MVLVQFETVYAIIIRKDAINIKHQINGSDYFRIFELTSTNKKSN